LGILSVVDEKIKILETEIQDKDFKGLRILGCSKTYKIANNCCGTKELKALKPVILKIIIYRPILESLQVNYLLC